MAAMMVAVMTVAPAVVAMAPAAVAVTPAVIASVAVVAVAVTPVVMVMMAAMAPVAVIAHRYRATRHGSGRSGILAGNPAHKLVGAHLEHLLRSGIRTVHLEVDQGNVPAQKLYARHGFRQVGERTGYYTRPDGSRATALTMTAVLA